MKTKKLLISSFIIMLIVFCISSFTTKTRGFVMYEGKNAFEGPFVYTGMTTYTYRYFSSNASNISLASTKNTVTIDESLTTTVTEEQNLYYWLHTPIHYNPSTKYPVVVFCPGSGCTVFDHEDYGTEVDLNTFDPETVYGRIKDSYMLNQGYSSMGYGDGQGNKYINTDGSVNVDAVMGEFQYGTGTSAGGAGQFVDQWYDLVYNQGKEEYDCFFIYIQPGDEMWWENKKNMKLLNIHTMGQATGIEGMEYSSSGTWGCYGSSYVASELSANIYSQLTNQLIDKLISNYSIDPRRQYMAGYSLGAQYSYDTACHYPDRYACMCITGLPASDLTLNNAKKLTNMNMWIVGGNSDLNPSFTEDFVHLVNNAKEQYGGDGVQQFTKFSGGHSGVYLTANYNSISYSSDNYAPVTAGSHSIIDFMFNSINNHIDLTEYEYNAKEQDKMNVHCYAYLTGANTYSLALVGNKPIGTYTEFGFAVTSKDVSLDAQDRTVSIPVNAYSSSININGEVVKASDLGSAYVFGKVINSIPTTVTSFDVRVYAVADSGIIYGNTWHVNIIIEGSEVVVTEACYD